MSSTSHTYHITHSETTEIIVGENLLENLNDIIKAQEYTGYMVLFDAKTETLFGQSVRQALSKLHGTVHSVILPSGESAKTFGELEKILSAASIAKLDKKSAIIAIGGGAITDLATVAAGLYFRGIDTIFIPTTLLSQVDAAIGGKGAVNLGTHKNSIGVVKQPRFVIVDTNTLSSLPKEEIHSGMGEITKYAIALDRELFDLLEKGSSDTINPEIISRCIQIKMRHVEEDPTDTAGKRAHLNFGHTLGHAIEKEGSLTHGEAVAIGMVFAIKLSSKLGKIGEEEKEKALGLIKKFHLPTSIKGLNREKVIDLMMRDKKAIGGKLKFVLLEEIGQATVEEIADDGLMLLNEVLL